MVATILELTYNLALLVALSVLSGFIRQRRSHPAWGAILQGLLFGGAAVIGMMKPLVLGPGLIFDGRSVMLSLCGLFFGPVAVGVAGVIALLYRTLLGGTGFHMGGLVIASSALLGLGFHHLWLRRGQSLTAGRLWRLGLLVHVVMILLMFTLPAGTGLVVIKRLGLPILLAYPLVTVLIGKVLASQEAGMRSVAALKESEAKHRLLIENSHDIIYTLTPEGVFTFVSPAWTALLGHPINQVVGQPFEPFLHRDDVALCQAWLQKVIETGERQEGVEYRVQHLDGSWRWHTSSAVPTRNEKGSVTGFEGTARDITERKAAEEALHEKNAELERYFSSSLDLLCIADAGGHFIRLNPEWEKALGYSLQDLEGRSFLELVHPEDMEGTLAAMSKLGAQEQVLSFENRYRCKDGSYRWIEWRSQPQGNLVYAAARDITERKQAEDALRSSENRFKTMFNEAPLGIALIDSCTGHIHAVNPVFAHIAGRSTEEMADINWIDITHPDDVQEDLDNMARMNAGEIPGFQMRKRYLHPDGEAVWIHMTIAPVRVEAHAAPRHLCMIMDITERNRTDEALRESEQKYRALFDGAGDAIFIHNAERMLAVNPLACERLGYTQPELLAMPPSAVDTPEQSQYVPERTASLLAQGHLTFETEHQRKNGSRVPTEAISRMITWEGHPAIMSICRDITERKQAQDALDAESAALTSVIDNNPLSIQVLDREGRTLKTNRAHTTLFGATPPPDYSVFSDPLVEAQGLSALWEKLRVGEVVFFPEFHYNAHDLLPEFPDVPVWVRMVGFSILGKDGQPERNVLMHEDVTQQRLAEQALRESEAQFRSYVDHAPIGVFVCDEKGRYLQVNPAATTITGYASEELLALSIPDTLPPESVAFAANAFKDVTETGRTSAEFAFRRKNGQIGMWALEGVRLSPTRFMGLVTDITERKKAEEELTHSKEALMRQNAVLSALLKSIPIGVFMVEAPSGKPLVANEMACELLGRGILPNVSKENLSEVYSSYKMDTQDRYPLEEMPIIRGMNGEASHVDDMMVERPDGTQALLEVFGSPVTDDQGRVWASVVSFLDITERKVAEQALGESEQKYRTLIDHLSAGIVVHGPDTGILLSNGMASTLLGLTAEQMQGKTAMDPRWCFLEEDGSAMPLSEYPVNRVFASGEGFQSQVVGIRHPERAELTWVLCNAYPVRDAKGWVVQAVITFTDITDRRRAEEALRLTRFSIENASDSMYWVTPDGRILDVNETGCRSLGYSRTELLALTVPELDVYLDAGDWPGHFAELRQLGSMTFESEQRHRDGRLIPVEVVENYLKFGEEEWNCAIIRDITDRKQAEEALHLSEQKFRTLFENLTEGVALHELVRDVAGKILDYRLLDVNPAYQHHTGLEALTAPGRLGTEIYETEVPPFLEEFSQVALGGEPYAFETFFPPLDKHFRISVISPKPGQFATVFEDITDRKRREEELKQKNAEMERFTYMISHDLKSPLVTVRTFLGYLEQDLEQGKAERVVKDMGFIRDATGKMGRLLEDLLEVSRVGRVVNPLVRVTLADLIQEALAAVAVAISTRGVAIQVEVPLVTFLGDRPRLEELWQNLVENAVKYMGDQPCPRIELGVEGTGADTVFFVRDNGQGIDPRFQDKVFGLFEQLDTASEGTGLGLALVKRIVELYEGRIWLESEGLGQGTCFRFTLPLALKVTPKNRKEGARP